MIRDYDDIYWRYLKKSRSNDLGDIMCKSLRKIQGLSAEDVLKRTSQEDAIPVDLDAIIDKLNLKKFPTTFERIEKDQNSGKISGLVLLNDDDVGIFYNKNDSIEKKRLVIAHELGHCCLHGDSLESGYIEFLHNDGFENLHEESATVFAMKLLIPERSLKDTIARLLLPSINTLSKIFQVPKIIMIRRMENLNLAYYLDDKDKLVKPKS